MDEPTVADPPVIASPPPPAPDVSDRRRPGRVNYTNPALVEMLRGQSEATAEPADAYDEPEDGLAPARGIVFGVMMGTVMWGMFAGLLWFLLRL